MVIRSGPRIFGYASLAWAVTQLACGDDRAHGGTGSSTGDPAPTSTSDATLETSSSGGGLSDSGTLPESSTSSASATGTLGATGGSTQSTAGDTTAGPVPDTRVLFLGNSYTQFNGMTGMVAELAADTGAELEVVAITQGGATVADLLERRDIQAAVAEPGWDFVVIQGQSYEPLAQPMVFEDAAVELAGLASAAGAEPVFFETWARVAGHELYDQPWAGGDPVGMQALLHAAYGAAADASGGTLAPVGQGWAQCLADSPRIVLHAGDGSHPTVAGSYLAAAVFHGVLGETPVTSNGWWPEAVSETEAVALQACADAAVATQ